MPICEVMTFASLRTEQFVANSGKYRMWPVTNWENVLVFPIFHRTTTPFASFRCRICRLLISYQQVTFAAWQSGDDSIPPPNFSRIMPFHRLESLRAFIRYFASSSTWAMRDSIVGHSFTISSQLLMGIMRNLSRRRNWFESIKACHVGTDLAVIASILVCLRTVSSAKCLRTDVKSNQVRVSLVGSCYDLKFLSHFLMTSEVTKIQGSLTEQPLCIAFSPRGYIPIALYAWILTFHLLQLPNFCSRKVKDLDVSSRQVTESTPWVTWVLLRCPAVVLGQVLYAKIQIWILPSALCSGWTARDVNLSRHQEAVSLEVQSISNVGAELAMSHPWSQLRLLYLVFRRFTTPQRRRLIPIIPVGYMISDLRRNSKSRHGHQEWTRPFLRYLSSAIGFPAMVTEDLDYQCRPMNSTPLFLSS